MTDVDKWTVREGVRHQLMVIGENPQREGLIDTPDRVAKSLAELYSGYEWSDNEIKKMMTTFPNQGCDEIVLLRDHTFYSNCEHHMLPFYGKMHIAYIPNKEIVGISKLCRLANVYSRRLQVQEVLTQQIATALMEHLQPLGAAVVVEGKHLCMMMRGVHQQDTIMTTSCMLGNFKNEKARHELFQLIRR